MGNITITLIRRCLMLSVITLASACSSINQMPHVTATDITTAVATESTVQIKVEESVKAIELSSRVVIQEPSMADTKVLDIIVKRFKVSKNHASQILSVVDSYADKEFPKRNDLLALIAVESRYVVNAVHNGCYGLMQIEKKSHAKKLQGRSIINPSVNIGIGADILKEYYLLTNKNKKAAILAYNAGIGNYLKGRTNPAYYTKYQSELKALS